MLSAIPVELLLLIASHLDHTSLINISSTCWRFAEVFQPLVFRTCHLPMVNCLFDLQFQRVYSYEYKQLNQVPIAVLAQHCLRYPRLGQHVRDLILHPFSPTNHSRTYQGCQWWKALAKAGDVLQSISGSQAMSNSWLQDLDRGWRPPFAASEDAWLALLLVLLTNLRSLRVFVPPSSRFTLVDRVLAYAVQRRCLTGLKSLDIQFLNSGHSEDFTLDRLFPYLHIPSLTNLTVSFLGGKSTSELDKKLSYSRLLQLTNIKLFPLCHWSPNLSRVISLCSNLRSFILFSSAESNIGGDTGTKDIFPIHPLHKALLMSQATLRVLTLDLDRNFLRLWQTAEFPERHFFRLMRDFERLKVLRIRLANVIEFKGDSWEPQTLLCDMLPRSLETLCITDFHVEAIQFFIDQLMNMAKTCVEQLPFLNVFHIRYPALEGPNKDPKYFLRYYNSITDLPATIRRLKRMFADDIKQLRYQFWEAGVDFKVKDSVHAIGIGTETEPR